MKWVLGTGRCGMHTYTALYGGYINSAQEWKDQSIKKHHGEPYDESLVGKIIIKRMRLPYPFITDCAQFMFLDEIKYLDKNASFVWLIRNKKDVIEGFMSKVAEDKRIHPKGWDFAYKNKRKLLDWYYDEVNRIIEKGLVGTKFEKIEYESLPKVSEKDIEKLRVMA